MCASWKKNSWICQENAWAGKIPCLWHTHMGKWQLLILLPVYLFLRKVQWRDKVQGKALPEQVHSQLPFTLNGLWVRMWGKSKQGKQRHTRPVGEGALKSVWSSFQRIAKIPCQKSCIAPAYVHDTDQLGVDHKLSFLQEVYGSDYSPYVDLYSEMGLPILDGMVVLWKEGMEWRTVHLK